MSVRPPHSLDTAKIDALKRWRSAAALSLGLIFFAFAGASRAQTQQLSQQQPQQPPVVRSRSAVVLVPTLVRTKTGDTVLGLTAKDFIVEDDGVEQQVLLDESPEAEPVSLVVCVQVGRDAEFHLLNPDGTGKTGASLSGIGTMLESYVGEGKASVAIVAFDSQVQIVQDFTDNISRAAEKLSLLAPGDGGAAILDAVLRSIDMLDRRPLQERRVILLISESRDHGSHVAKLENVIERLGATNTLVYSISFSPARTEFMRDIHGQNPNSGNVDLFAPIAMGVNALRKNAADTVAELSGGEYFSFKGKHAFDAQMSAISGDDHNRYLLSFQPANPKPGAHTISVKLRKPQPNQAVIARTMYWAVGAPGQ
jgi:VWFA-related protein